MTEEVYKELKKGHVQHILTMLEKTGNVYPHVTILADKEGEEKPTIIHIPILANLMDSDEAKDRLIEEVFPEIKEELKSQGFTVKAVCFASEVWIRETTPEEFEATEDYTDLNVTNEGVFISIDDEKEGTVYSYKIIRGHMAVGEEGLTGNVSVEEINPPKVSPRGEAEGRFANLYDRFSD